jgi:hypothetical protein
MTERDPDDIEAWAEALAGRARAGDADAERRLAALREAIRAENAGARDDVGLQKLLARLEREGLLEGRAAAARRPSRFVAMALAASVVGIAVAVGIQLWRPPGVAPGVEVYRGFAGGVRIDAADPDARAAELAAQARDNSARVQVTRRDERVIVELEVAEAELEKFRPWFRQLGGVPAGAGTYRVIVVKAGS